MQPYLVGFSDLRAIKSPVNTRRPEVFCLMSKQNSTSVFLITLPIEHVNSVFIISSWVVLHFDLHWYGHTLLRTKITNFHTLTKFSTAPERKRRTDAPRCCVTNMAFQSKLRNTSLSTWLRRCTYRRTYPSSNFGQPGNCCSTAEASLLSYFITVSRYCSLS